MIKPTENYLTKPLSTINQKPVGRAKFKEPVFKLGQFMDRYIEVDVVVYPVSVQDPETNKKLIGVRFGEMPVLRFIERGLLYNINIPDQKTARLLL